MHTARPSGRAVVRSEPGHLFRKLHSGPGRCGGHWGSASCRARRAIGATMASWPEECWTVAPRANSGCGDVSAVAQFMRFRCVRVTTGSGKFLLLRGQTWQNRSIAPPHPAGHLTARRGPGLEPTPQQGSSGWGTIRYVYCHIRSRSYIHYEIYTLCCETAGRLRPRHVCPADVIGSLRLR